MRKSTLYISAALTTFMLAVLFGVASAYRSIISSTQPVGVQSQLQSQPSAVVETAAVIVSPPTQISAPTQIPPTQAVKITPEEAAKIASDVLGRTDLYSAEVAQLNGVDTYLITFSSGDLVNVGFDGQILSISKLPVTTIVQPSGGGRRGGGGGGGGGEGGGEGGGGEGGGD